MPKRHANEFFFFFRGGTAFFFYMQPHARALKKLVCDEVKGCQMKKKSRKMGIKKMSCGCATHSKGKADGKDGEGRYTAQGAI